MTKVFSQQSPILKKFGDRNLLIVLIHTLFPLSDGMRSDKKVVNKSSELVACWFIVRIMTSFSFVPGKKMTISNRQPGHGIRQLDLPPGDLTKIGKVVQNLVCRLRML